ncbi:hypothetical protein JR316_0007150 [Psilocybe cubensis]|uniref:Uncharacterized protein n=1 Tax=Psilocybe cubensis TaxID=181762 RepID=A0ACB8GXS7_PSICU|nr:hypothetical protein JR316_0007150 [Psilocybe cubensis]KAH9480550.1 hypothetical protein JR316_0007150 [Psilocybe cubensis]
MQTTSSSVDGGSARTGKAVNESTPLLNSGSEYQCGIGPSYARTYDGSSLRSSIAQCSPDPDRDSDEDNIQSISRISIQKDKCLAQRSSQHKWSRTNIGDDTETFQSTGDAQISSKLPFRVLESVSLRLENSGSVARDHLASERTFLAYMRTSLAIASSGVALVQLFSVTSTLPTQGPPYRLQAYIRPLGASTVFIGILVLFIGVTRYFTVQSALTKGYFPVARIATSFIAIVLTARP